MKLGLSLAVGLAIGGCALDEVVTANSEDIVIAEIYLRTDVRTQSALLHRTRQPSDSALAVPDARIELTHVDDGRVMRYFPAADTLCTAPPARPRPLAGTCYVSEFIPGFFILPGERYAIRITLGNGGEITGTTDVPRGFNIIRPAAHDCSVAPRTRFEVTWQSSENAWVYASEVAIRGLSDALAPQGLDIPEPLRLFGLSISSSDTTISFPNEFGLFDRFDPDVTEALVLIQPGLPEGTSAQVVIAAADRNYVNWERGGNFNPSGVVRIGNLRGDGTGVFGSLAIEHFHVNVGGSDPAC